MEVWDGGGDVGGAANEEMQTAAQRQALTYWNLYRHDAPTTPKPRPSQHEPLPPCILTHPVSSPTP